MEERVLTWTRQATYTQIGCITVSENETEEEIRKRIIEGDYDDIIDTCLEDEDDTTINIEFDGEE